jgi:hypothetical protein
MAAIADACGDCDGLFVACRVFAVVTGDEHALSDIASAAAAAAATAGVVTWMCRRHPLASFSTIIPFILRLRGSSWPPGIHVSDGATLRSYPAAKALMHDDYCPVRADQWDN